MHQIRIVSNGLANGTKVFNADGSEICGINRLEVVIDARTGIAEATLRFLCVDLAIEADWINHPLRQWAEKKTSGFRGK